MNCSYIINNHHPSLIISSRIMLQHPNANSDPPTFMDIIASIIDIYASMRLAWPKTSRCYCFVILILATLLLFLLLHGTSPNHSLLQRIERLEARNSRLHKNLQALTSGRANKEVGILLHQEGGMSTDREGSHSDGGKCEVIHLAMVVSGSQTIRQLMVLVKSILFYRHNPIHFHLLTDTRGMEALSTIFNTWQLPAVNVSFYPLSSAVEMVAWIPNSHYSGVFGLAKLTFPSILPGSLNAVIVLDTDLMLAADIGELWKYVKRLRKGKKILGLVENQSDWYLGGMGKPWPAVGRGFNTGVTLLNLELMRTRDWNQTWHVIAGECLISHSRVKLADQDVINAAVKKDGNLVFILPCNWNIQLGKNTLSDYCLKSVYDFKIVHWNSAAKLDVDNVYAPHFKNLFSMFEDYNSMLFKTYISDCPPFSSLEPAGASQESDEARPCLDMENEVKMTRRVHPFYLNYSYSSDDKNDVTLVAQMSVNRLHMLESLCEHWDGPLSIAIYASDAEMGAVMAHIAASPVLKKFRKLGLHVVSKGGRFYPVNHLRNVALSNVKTPYVYLSDIDFLPMRYVYYYIKEAIRVLGMNRRALIVPAFESLLYRVDFPNNKSQLISMLHAGKLFTFRYHVWKQGHSPTNFEYWKTAKRPYRVKWAKDFEPYLVVSSNVSRYDERFVGFGWNKVSHVMELTAQGYELVVLPEAFMVHMPHAPSADIVSYRQSKHYRDCMQVLKREFEAELEHKYRKQPT